MEVQELIGKFGAEIGVADLVLDHENRCNLLFNDIAVSLEANSNRQDLFVYSYLADIPRKLKDSLNLQIAYSNCRMKDTQGMTVGVERGSGKTVLMQTVSLRGLQLKKFLDTVEQFIKNAEEWTKAIRYFSPNRPFAMLTREGYDEDETSLEQEDAPPMGLRV